jgi:hypothetical protein
LLGHAPVDRRECQRPARGSVVSIRGGCNVTRAEVHGHVRGLQNGVASSLR